MLNRPLPALPGDVALLIGRVVLGIVLFAHGWQKLMINGISATYGQFEKLGIPLAIVSASFTSFVEFVGGVLLILGALTTTVIALDLVVMVGAAGFVHVTHGIFAQDGGWELVGVIVAAEVALAAAGPGRYSVDHWIASRRKRDDHRVRVSLSQARREAAARRDGDTPPGGTVADRFVPAGRRPLAESARDWTPGSWDVEPDGTRPSAPALAGARPTGPGVTARHVPVSGVPVGRRVAPAGPRVATQTGPQDAVGTGPQGAGPVRAQGGMPTGPQAPAHGGRHPGVPGGAQAGAQDVAQTGSWGVEPAGLQGAMPASRMAARAAGPQGDRRPVAQDGQPGQAAPGGLSRAPQAGTGTGAFPVDGAVARQAVPGGRQAPSGQGPADRGPGEGPAGDAWSGEAAVTGALPTVRDTRPAPAPAPEGGPRWLAEPPAEPLSSGNAWHSAPAAMPAAGRRPPAPRDLPSSGASLFEPGPRAAEDDGDGDEQPRARAARAYVPMPAAAPTPAAAAPTSAAAPALPASPAPAPEPRQAAGPVTTAETAATAASLVGPAGGPDAAPPVPDTAPVNGTPSGADGTARPAADAGETAGASEQQVVPAGDGTGDLPAGLSAAVRRTLARRNGPRVASPPPFGVEAVTPLDFTPTGAIPVTRPPLADTASADYQPTQTESLPVTPPPGTPALPQRLPRAAAGPRA